MRILEVIEFFSPSMGGSAQVAYQTARHLAARGHEVTVVASDFSADGARFPDEDFQTLLFPCAFARWGFYVTPGLIGWARRHLAGYDIIHLHNVRTFQNAVVGGLARRRSVPYVLSAHGSLPIIIQRQAPKRIFDFVIGHRLIDNAAQLLAVSPFETSQYVDAGIPRDRVRVILNGIDLHEFETLPPRGELRQRLALPDSSAVVLYLGRLHQRKGINHLIDAFAALRRRIRDAILIIAGPDDGELARLKGQVDALKLGNHVYFTGPLYGQDKLTAYVDTDVLVSPAIHEIFGLVPFEALMCGTPVIVADDSGSGQLIAEAGAGYLVRYGDVDGLTNALEVALDCPEKTDAMIRAGQNFARSRLHWPAIAQELEQVYEGALSTEAAAMQSRMARS